MISIVIPTFNHPSYLKYLFDNCVIPYKGKAFDIYILDSSVNNDTEDLIIKYTDKLPIKIFYMRYPSTIDPDIKSHIGLSQADGDYLYLMGDGISPDLTELERILIKNNYGKYDFLGIPPKEYKDSLKATESRLVDKVYTYSLCAFAKDNFYFLTLYGGSIIKKTFFQYILETKLFEFFNCEGRFSYAHISSCFLALSKKPSFSYGVMYCSATKGNPIKKENTWVFTEKFWSIFIHELKHDVFKLPTEFNSVKSDIISTSRKFTFGLGFLLRLRERGILDAYHIKVYKLDLESCKYRLTTLKIISIIPKQVVTLLFKLRKHKAAQ